MYPPRLIDYVAQLLFKFRRGDQPSDRLTRDLFYQHRAFGSRDRRFIGDTFHHALRHLARIDAELAPVVQPSAEEMRLAGFPVGAPESAAAWYSHSQDEATTDSAEQGRPLDLARAALAAAELNPDSAAALAARVAPSPVAASAVERLFGEAQSRLHHILDPQVIPEDPPTAYSLPGWLMRELAEGRVEHERFAVARSLLAQAPTTIRTNALWCTGEEARAALDQAGIEYRRGELSPFAIHLERRVGPAQLPRVGEGWFEFQDEASQLASIFAAPAPGSIVVDACAGAGGKSLHLAVLMQNSGHILAFDAAKSRLSQLRERAKEAGVRIIVLGQLDAQFEPLDCPPADLVLIDAPCSGIGTLRRDPGIRWRLSPARLEELITLQSELLARWSHFVKPGGILLYATCSLLKRENQDQVEAFLASHPQFERDEASSIDPRLLDARGDLDLSPERHGCDGFYAARLRRNPRES